MLRIVSFTLLLLLFGCAAPPSRQALQDDVVSNNGTAIAAQLEQNYRDTRAVCPESNARAFQCNGVLLRATTRGVGYHVWNPSPASVKSHGVSFSYLRQDAKFGRLAFGGNNGLIFYPASKAPVHSHFTWDICAFPMDGWTWKRGSPSGCGASVEFPGTNSYCKDLGISTAEQWVTLWKGRYAEDANLRQCAFVSSQPGNFEQFTRAKALLGDAGFKEQNEVILSVWPQYSPEQIPLMAFFYMAGGVAEAQANQRDYFEASRGKIVPVIRLTLPATLANDARFEFIPSDQVK
ncbi:halovibrin HvnA [Pseudomonas sp. PB103]|uniref:halovibrin HvnA n=1 Tax=Pseudomonas sp. PB103 TaxID=2494698 RepID=UPI00131C586F|nr:halovibrin HvnA [Pseudomonas sp. PB103]KAE9648344.1 halovibrin HvnA [Pseudomonas sp. PB103]